MEIVNSKKDEDLIVLSQAANDLRNKLSDADNVEKKLTNELRIAQEKTKAAPQSP